MKTKLASLAMLNETFSVIFKHYEMIPQPLIVFWINDFEKKTKFASHFPPFQKGNFQDFPQIEDFFLGSQNDLKLFAARGARSRKINEARVNYVSSIVIKAHQPPKARKEMKIRKLRSFWHKTLEVENICQTSLETSYWF